MKSIKNKFLKSKNYVTVNILFTMSLCGGKAPYFYGCLKTLFLFRPLYHYYCLLCFYFTCVFISVLTI